MDAYCSCSHPDQQQCVEAHVWWTKLGCLKDPTILCGSWDFGAYAHDNSIINIEVFRKATVCVFEGTDWKVICAAFCVVRRVVDVNDARKVFISFIYYYAWMSVWVGWFLLGVFSLHLKAEVFLMHFIVSTTPEPFSSL